MDPAEFVMVGEKCWRLFPGSFHGHGEEKTTSPLDFVFSGVFCFTVTVTKNEPTL